MRKQKETQRMLSELKKGDDIVTTGGIVGRISGIKDDEVTLQVQEGVRLRVLRSAVAGRHKVGESKQDTKAS
jgi:preprotein translocase subunit YajC